MKALEQLEELRTDIEFSYNNDEIDFTIYRCLTDRLDELGKTTEKEYGTNNQSR